MYNTHKKALVFASKSLNDFDSFNVYRSISKFCDSEKVTDEFKRKMLENFQTAISVEQKKVKEAKEWIDSVISDLQKN